MESLTSEVQQPTLPALGEDPQLPAMRASLPYLSPKFPIAEERVENGATPKWLDELYYVEHRTVGERSKISYRLLLFGPTDSPPRPALGIENRPWLAILRTGMLVFFYPAKEPQLIIGRWRSEGAKRLALMASGFAAELVAEGAESGRTLTVATNTRGLPKDKRFPYKVVTTQPKELERTSLLRRAEVEIYNKSKSEWHYLRIHLATHIMRQGMEALRCGDLDAARNDFDYCIDIYGHGPLAADIAFAYFERFRSNQAEGSSLAMEARRWALRAMELDNPPGSQLQGELAFLLARLPPS
jgi:hypothetical protein